MRRSAGFHLMYLGAFTALEIQNVEVAKTLAEITENEAEAVHAIVIMRAAGHAAADRVYAALEWLREQRETPPTVIRQRATMSAPDGTVSDCTVKTTIGAVGQMRHEIESNGEHR